MQPQILLYFCSGLGGPVLPQTGTQMQDLDLQVGGEWVEQ
jgi:hypothetical protein